MFGFLTLNTVVFGDNTRRLLGVANQERRRADAADSALADSFGLAAGMRCELATHSFTLDGAWTKVSGGLSITAPEAKNGLNYVLKLKNDDAGNAWKDCDASSLAKCSGCDSWGVSSKDAAALVIDPADYTDGHQWPYQWANFGAAFDGTDMEKDVDVFWCYTPPFLYLESSTTDELKKSVVGIMGFLAQGSWETGAWVSCDEINHTGWEKASCSQKANDGTQLYQDVGASSPHACELDSTMSILGDAETEAKKLKCGSGYDPDLTNCCWWGRGSIQTTGPGNYGELQHNVVKHSDSAALKDVDLCKNPEKLCENDELKFVAGIYFWVTQVQADACYEETLDVYLSNYELKVSVNKPDYSCRAWAYGIGGKVNMGNWNREAHGEDCEYRKEHDDSSIDCTVNPDGRVERFELLMAAVKTALEEYDSPAANPTECTGNDAVDTIFDAVNIATLTGFTDTYKFSGFCAAIREFLP